MGRGCTSHQPPPPSSPVTRAIRAQVTHMAGTLPGTGRGAGATTPCISVQLMHGAQRQSCDSAQDTDKLRIAPPGMGASVRSREREPHSSQVAPASSMLDTPARGAESSGWVDGWTEGKEEGQKNRCNNIPQMGFCFGEELSPPE